MWPLRRVVLFAVVLGVMVVSIHGQVEATSPLLGTRLGVLFALTLDMSSLLALNEVLSTVNVSVRRWGWVALTLAAGLSVGLNVWHAVASGTLPLPAAIGIGAGPVVLAGVLSHLLALSLSGHADGAVPVDAGTDDRYRSGVVPAGTGTGAWTERTGTGRVVPTPAGTGGETGAATGTGSAAGTAGGAIGTGPAVPQVVPSPVSIRSAASRATRASRPADGRARRALPAGRVGARAETAVDGLPPAARALWTQARDLDARHRREHGEGLSRRRLMATYGIGTSTAVPLHRALAAAAGGAGTGTTAGSAPTGTSDTGTGGEPVPPGGTGTGGTGSTGEPAETTAGTGARLALVSGTETSEPTGTGEDGGIGTGPVARVAGGAR